MSLAKWPLRVQANTHHGNSSGAFTVVTPVKITHWYAANINKTHTVANPGECHWIRRFMLHKLKFELPAVR